MKVKVLSAPFIIAIRITCDYATNDAGLLPLARTIVLSFRIALHLKSRPLNLPFSSDQILPQTISTRFFVFQKRTTANKTE